MTGSLADAADIAAFLPFTMSDDEIRECNGALMFLSDDARHYGSDKWQDDLTTPNEVKNLVIKAAVRHMKNYEGYISNRAGDESVAWAQPLSSDETGSARFSPAERSRLADLGGRQANQLHSVNTFAYQTKLHQKQVGYVPDGSADGFPLFSSDTEPW